MGLIPLAIFGKGLFGGDVLLGREFVDAYGTQWFYHFADQALATNQPLTQASTLFWPWGKDLMAHSGANLLDALLAVPFLRFLGPVSGYNSFVTIIFLASGLLFYRFVHESTRDPIAAVVGTAVFLLQPWPLAELAAGRPTQGLLVLVVAVVYFLWRTTTLTNWLSPLLAGVSLALLAYQYWYYGLFAGFGAFVFGCASIVTGGQLGGPRRLRLARLGLAGILACILVFPVAHGLINNAAEGNVPGLLDLARWTDGRAPPITVEGAQVTLHVWQPLAGWMGFLQAPAPTQERFLPQLAASAWPIAATTLLFLLRTGPLPRLPILAMLIAAVMISVGPILIVNGNPIVNAAYVAAAEALPFLRRLWWPARAYAIIAVVFPALFAVVLARLSHRPRLQLAIGAIAAATSFARLHTEGLFPFPTWKPQIEAGYQCLAQTAEGAVAELPWAWSQRHLIAQTQHHHPILGGMNERDPSFTPVELRELASRNALVADLISNERGGGPQTGGWTQSDLDEVGDLGFRWIVYQLDALEPTQSASPGAAALSSLQRASFRRWERALGDPVYRDARLVIWAPWGHGSPCAGAEPPPDRAALGRTEGSPLFRFDDAIEL